MIRLTKLSVSSLLLGLVALGGAAAAHATQCTAEGGSTLDNTLFNQFGPNTEGSCGGNPPPPHEENKGGDEHEEGGGPWFPPPHDGWHDGKYFKDGKECNPPVVPLPPSGLLLVSGALALLILGRRRRPATA